MTNLPELPEKYYLGHFLEFLQEVQERCAHLLEAEHLGFYRDFFSLPEEAQCFYVRMVNRKGRFFFKQKMIYSEITSPLDAQEQLRKLKFLNDLAPEDHQDILLTLSRDQLRLILESLGIEFKKSFSKAKLLELLSGMDFKLPLNLHQDILVQGRMEELRYLIFLYFGKIQDNLSLYTLRDLGIKKVNSYQKPLKSRFMTQTEARSHYFYALHDLDPDKAPEYVHWPEPLNPDTRLLKDDLLYRKALLLLNDNEDSALEYLTLSQKHPAREKLVRLLHKRGDQEKARSVLENILSEPFSEEEILFAEDFLARKYGEKKLSLLTETLNSSKQIDIDENYFRHPEIGVIDFLKDQGMRAVHTENHLWNLCFALLFWEEIFHHENSMYYTEFDLLPSDLWNGEFYKNHSESIQNKLKIFCNREEVLAHFESVMVARQEEQLGIFSWDDESREMLLAFLRYIPLPSLANVMLTMARDYSQFSTGFPDLIVFDEDKIKFLEIKAQGDSLKHSQLKIINLLNREGIPVEILRVQYRSNPDQLYVVVDLETTGGRSEYDRVTEVGAVKMRGERVIETFQSLVHPERSIPRHIQELTGITNAMVVDAPKFSEISQTFSEFTEGCIFVAHNVNFDYKFLQEEYRRLDEKFVRPFICTKQGMRKSYPKLESYSLSSLTKKFNIGLENHHRALCDAQAASELLKLILKKREN